MPSNFPGGPDNIQNNVANATLEIDTHPNLHNQLADSVNAIESSLLAGGSLPAMGVAVYVESYRAPGDDDAMVWQKAINAATRSNLISTNSRTTVVGGARQYDLPRTLTIPDGTVGLRLAGASMYATVLHPVGSFPAVTIGTSTGTVADIQFADLAFAAGQNTVTISCNLSARTVFTNVQFYNCNVAVLLSGANVIGVRFHDCYWIQCAGDNVLANGTAVNNVYFDHCWFQSSLMRSYVSLAYTGAAGACGEIGFYRTVFEGPANASTVACLEVGSIDELELNRCHFADFTSGHGGKPLIKTVGGTPGMPIFFQMTHNDFVNYDGAIIDIGHNAGGPWFSWNIIGGRMDWAGTAPITTADSNSRPNHLNIIGVVSTGTYDWANFNFNANFGVHVISSVFGTSGYGMAALGFNANNPIFSTSGLNVGSSVGSLGWTDATLYRDAANTLAQRNGTNAQTLSLYRSYTDASNYQRLRINTGAASPNEVTIQAENAGTGTSQNILILANETRIQYDLVLIQGAGTGLKAVDGSDLRIGQRLQPFWWKFENLTGHFKAVTDNTYDIGASGANRPRNLWIGNCGIFGNVGSAITNSMVAGDIAVGRGPSAGVIFFGQTSSGDCLSYNTGVYQLNNPGGSGAGLQFNTYSTLRSGSGAPAAGLGANGDYYFRFDTPGTANQRVYVKSAGTWTGIL